MFKIGDISLPKHALFLAPMEDVTDPPFRLICKTFGVDVVYTEFISSDGLIHDADKSIAKLDIVPQEKPAGIQLFGNNTDSMVEAAKIAESVSPDFIDINFGCPVKKITVKGAGAGLLNNIPKMTEITRKIVNAVNLPVTVKTRLGWDDNNQNITHIAEALQDVGIKAIAIHGRTRAQLYRGKADWTLIGKVKNNPRIKIPVIGNGDITNGTTAKKKAERYNVDGLMIGRAAIGNPWIFDQIKHYLKTGESKPLPSIKEKAEVCREHLVNSIKWKGEKKAILEMRKHYSQYFKSISNFKPYRVRLMNTKDFNELLEIIDEIKMLEQY